MAKVVALVEHDAREGTVRRSTCALLTLARRLGEPVAVCSAAPDAAAVRVLGQYGATEIWYPEPQASAAARLPGRQTADVGAARPGDMPAFAEEPSSAAAPSRSTAGPAVDSALGDGLFGGQAAESVGVLVRGAGVLSVSEVDILVSVAQRLKPAAVLIAATYRGQESAARLAIRLDSGIITNAIDIRPGPDGRPTAIQRCLADSHLVESTVIRGIPVITVGPEAAVPELSPATPSLRPIPVAPSRARTPRITATPKPRQTRPSLDHADIVVAGGRGVGSRAAFAVLADVAEALGAAVAGSHTAAELGWIPPEARVGLTGKTVHPRLYLACGVSGSVRHRAGMQGAKTVIAIGDDPAAPIFKLAELGVVGDAAAILPALLDEIRARTHLSDPA